MLASSCDVYRSFGLVIDTQSIRTELAYAEVTTPEAALLATIDDEANA